MVNFNVCRTFISNFCAMDVSFPVVKFAGNGGRVWGVRGIGHIYVSHFLCWDAGDFVVVIK